MARVESHADDAAASRAELMDTREVAAYLRLKERRIYDLVRQRAIPHVRATAYGAALASDRPAARAFIDYLATSPAREALSASGFMPQ